MPRPTRFSVVAILRRTGAQFVPYPRFAQLHHHIPSRYAVCTNTQSAHALRYEVADTTIFSSASMGPFMRVAEEALIQPAVQSLILLISPHSALHLQRFIRTVH